MINIEKEHEDNLKREAIIELKNPEQPLIHVERQESGEYKAVFALELEGVINSNKDPNQNQEKDTDQERFRDSLIACLSAHEKLDFVYSGGRDAQGCDCFSWRIVGSATGNLSELAVYRTHQLWQNLSVLLSSTEREFRFVPVNLRESLVETEVEEPWVATIIPSGIAIDGGTQRKIGFNAGSKLDCRAAGKVIVPFVADKPIKSIDSVVIGASRCPAPVKLVLSITPLTLSTEDLKKAGTAIECLNNGEKNQIKYHDVPGESIEDINVLNGLKQNLTQWLKGPSGFRISCKIISQKPVPKSFLQMVGGELFHGCPITMNVENKEDGNGSNPDIRERLGPETLDLRGCINVASSLPPLFPQASTLMDRGIRRAYKQHSQACLIAGFFLEGLETVKMFDLLGLTEADTAIYLGVPGQGSRPCFTT